MSHAFSTLWLRRMSLTLHLWSLCVQGLGGSDLQTILQKLSGPAETRNGSNLEIVDEQKESYVHHEPKLPFGLRLRAFLIPQCGSQKRRTLRQAESGNTAPGHYFQVRREYRNCRRVPDVLSSTTLKRRARRETNCNALRFPLVLEFLLHFILIVSLLP